MRSATKWRGRGTLREMSRTLRSTLPLLLLGALWSCGEPYARQAPVAAATPSDSAPAPAAATPTPAAKPAKAPEAKAVPDRHEDGKPLGKILASAPLPIAKILGQSPPDAETQLGPHMPDSKGGRREACVRYLPERTWFSCKFAWQRYSDATNTFGVVHLTYEDGKASGLAFENIPGEGDFDPRAALKVVGLELPGEPLVENPQPEVTIYNWWNARARLVIHERQYRVRVSTVSGKWDTAKVEIILNDPLSDSEKARIIENPEGKKPAP